MAEARQVAQGVYAIEGLKTGRAYLIDDRDGLTLIDTSSRGAGDGILAAIVQIGRRAEDLRTIVATHYHHDHTGNVEQLRERSGAELLVHSTDRSYVEGGTPWMNGRGLLGSMLDRRAPAQYALRVDRELRDGEVLPVAGGLRVVHAPGHTPGHIALYAPERDTLFAGDAFGNWFGLGLPFAPFTHDMDEAKRSIRRLAALEFDVALPGHGSPVLSRASEKLREWVGKWL